MASYKLAPPPSAQEPLTPATTASRWWVQAPSPVSRQESGPTSHQSAIVCELFVCPSIYLSVHLFDHLSVWLSICLSVLCLSVHPFVCLSMNLSPFCLSICLSVVYLFVCLSIHLSVCPFVCLSVHPFVSVCPSICLSVCISICLSVCLSVCLSLKITSCLLSLYLQLMCAQSYKVLPMVQCL